MTEEAGGEPGATIRGRGELGMWMELNQRGELNDWAADLRDEINGREYVKALHASGCKN